MGEGNGSRRGWLAGGRRVRAVARSGSSRAAGVRGREGRRGCGPPSGPVQEKRRKKGRRGEWAASGQAMSWAEAGKTGRRGSAGRREKKGGPSGQMREGRFYFFPNPFSFLNSKQFKIRTKSSINTIQNTLFSSNINEPILGKFF